ncbi:UbiA family prenyltransferase [Bacteriovorax sp. PP10]|uniref:UbiA family prenyltransferase n=1 Tax=Bacteriovorax antarcticus TaxID=3088717 RepID=A0ABU5VZ09_9BACT|nr:UbiA family prenyltransferase [Bacteriovorax sp. PP10]MEA9358297.1 UbiA family prenyltransferase [Bacteriovorax sp. PP10]
MTKQQAWWQFTKERFEPASHLTMILVFIIAHILVAKATVPLVASSMNYLVLLIGVIAFYFKLRLYDEVKDYELDVVINKTRPLPRGLLNHKDMYRGMAICIAIELVCFSLMGLESFISIVIAILYSLLMYKEFFIAEKIRPYLTTYALIHTIVTTLLSFAIFSFLTKLTIIQIIMTPSFLSFAMANWLLFNIFEFGRKTFASSEERQSVDTYSSLFGRTGAVVLVASQAVITYYLATTLTGSNTTILFWGLGSLLVLLAVLSLHYIFADSSKTAKRFRLFSSVYIIVFYLILIFSYLKA